MRPFSLYLKNHCGLGKGSTMSPLRLQIGTDMGWSLTWTSRLWLSKYFKTLSRAWKRGNPCKKSRKKFFVNFFRQCKTRGKNWREIQNKTKQKIGSGIMIKAEKAVLACIFCISCNAKQAASPEKFSHQESVGKEFLSHQEKSCCLSRP